MWRAALRLLRSPQPTALQSLLQPVTCPGIAFRWQQPAHTTSLVTTMKNALNLSTSATNHAFGRARASPEAEKFFRNVYHNEKLELIHKNGPRVRKRNPPLNPIGEKGKPMVKGVVLRTVIKKPKKPNSANRKCVLLKLSTGKRVTAYVPGEGHNLQEHNVVLCKVRRLRDVPGVKLYCVRGAYDLAHVKKK